MAFWEASIVRCDNSPYLVRRHPTFGVYILKRQLAELPRVLCFLPSRTKFSSVKSEGFIGPTASCEQNFVVKDHLWAWAPFYSNGLLKFEKFSPSFWVSGKRVRTHWRKVALIALLAGLLGRAEGLLKSHRCFTSYNKLHRYYPIGNYRGIYYQLYQQKYSKSMLLDD